MADFGQQHQQIDGNQFNADTIIIGAETAVPTALVGRLQPSEAELTRAQQRLAQLPIDDIQEPAPLPAGSHAIYSRNELFVGRADDLRELARILKGGEIVAIGQIAVASGMGGIGKSQLASEFAHRYGQFFAGGVYWLSFADPAAIQAEVAICGGERGMNLPNFAGRSLQEQVSLVQATWDTPLPRLLVFDNCEDPQLLTEWQPRTGGCRVLVTGRNSRWNPALGVKEIHLDTLTPVESVQLLHKFRSDLAIDNPGLAATADELGHLPLALHLAGSYLFEVGLSPALFLDRVKKVGPLAHEAFAGREEACSPTRHERHVGKTFQLSLEQLKTAGPTDALALALLARAAHFSPGEPVPRDLLLATIGSAKEAVKERGLLAVRRLVALGLLEQAEADTLRLHRLLAAFVRVTVIDDAAAEAVEETLAETVATRNREGRPLKLLSLEPHLRAVANAAISRNSIHAAWLASELGYHLCATGDLAAARPYCEHAVAINEKSLGPDHPQTATCLNNLGTLLHDQGDLTAARPYLERTLAIREKVLDPDHPSTATSLNNLGMLLQALGDPAAAGPYLERAVAICEKVLGPEHPDTAGSLNNLGTLLKDQGDLTAARPYLERGLAIYEKVLGPEHPDTAASLNNLGNLLQDKGDLAGARPYYERALAITEKVRGPEHPNTATRLNNLGMLLQALGDPVAARPYLERALAICEKVLRPEHPDTAASLSNLGSVLKEGDPAAARPYLERALAIRQRRGERYQEGIAFYSLGLLAIRVGHIVEGSHLLALSYLIDAEIGDADVEQDLRTLTGMTEQLGYSEVQRDELIADAQAAYAKDYGWGLVRAAFEDTAVDTTYCRNQRCRA